ncbi:hypothetical protein NpPPO83_00007860 [Neofusicoccum parvum]|uniref:Uncharacterized protein n=1 Tax=Neofusicoccum parvum TaxID=310453 RepID=A0ACB5SQG2_9PEZI|nr:hypothetical protein NpPPO83_00007860 [Neofusicoccum parvum]
MEATPDQEYDTPADFCHKRHFSEPYAVDKVVYLRSISSPKPRSIEHSLEYNIIEGLNNSDKYCHLCDRRGFFDHSLRLDKHLGIHMRLGMSRLVVRD